MIKGVFLLLGSTAFYGGLHFVLIRAIAAADLTIALEEASALLNFEATPNRLALRLAGCIQVNKMLIRE